MHTATSSALAGAALLSTPLLAAAGPTEASEAQEPEHVYVSQRVTVGEDAKLQVSAATEVTARPAPEPVVDDVAAPAASEASSNVPAPSGTGQQVLDLAAQYTGIPYVWGGTTTSGFDCSAYVQFIYSKVGVNLPRTSGAQKAAGTVVAASEARAGDLVWRPGHIGIYAGDGMMYDAGSSAGTSYRSHSWMGSVTYIRVL